MIRLSLIRWFLLVAMLAAPFTCACRWGAFAQLIPSTRAIPGDSSGSCDCEGGDSHTEEPEQNQPLHPCCCSDDPDAGGVRLSSIELPTDSPEIAPWPGAGERELVLHAEPDGTADFAPGNRASRAERTLLRQKCALIV